MLRNKKVLLIIPPYEIFRNVRSEAYPLGPLYIAANLVKEGWINTKVLNLDYIEINDSITRLKKSWITNVTEAGNYFEAINDNKNIVWKNLEECLKETKPDVIGINSTTLTVESALQVAKISRKFSKDSIIVVGGPGPTIHAEKYLYENSCIDYVIKGEGEYAFVSLMEKIESEELNGIDSLPGIVCYRDGKIYETSGNSFIHDLDLLPYPDPNLMWNGNQENIVSYLITSRGCPFACSFCSNIWGSRVRFRSAKNVVDEISFLVKERGKRNFLIYDDTFTSNQKRASEICKYIIEEKLDIKFVCNVRADCINDELLEDLKRAGCTTVTMGVESGSERILKLLDKRLTISKIKESAKKIKSHGLQLKTSFMCGIPTETKDDMEKTIDLLKCLDPFRGDLHVYMPMPNTKLYEFILENKISSKEEIDLSTQDGLQKFHSNFSSMSTKEFEDNIVEMFKIFDDHNDSKKSYSFF